MLSTIFQPEVSTLESQVAALQAQIAAAQQRIALLAETELLAGGSLEALKGAIEKVSSLAPDAIATLRAAVLDLFRGDSSNDGNGNQPINPAPQRSDDGGRKSAIAVIKEPRPPLELFNPEIEKGLEDAIAPLEELLTGQMCELSSPYCQLPEDAPRIELDTACTVDTPEPQPEQPQPYVELIPVTHLVAYQRLRVDGEIVCAYLGGNNKSRLKDWGSWLCNQHSVGSGFELREAKRMTAYKWELKIWGMSIKQVVRLSETDTTKSVPSRYHVASFPVAEKLLAPFVEDVQHVPDREVEAVLTSVVKSELGVDPESQGFQVGDALKVISDRHGVELVGQTGIVTAGTAAGAAVNVGGTLRWFCADELAAVSTPVSAADLEPTCASKVAIASIQPPAYNLNPMGRAGAIKNWKARQASGIGVNLKDCGTGGISSIEEWQRIEADQKAQKALEKSTPDTATDDE